MYKEKDKSEIRADLIINTSESGYKDNSYTRGFHWIHA